MGGDDGHQHDAGVSMTPEREAALARFNRDFRIVPTSLFNLPRDLRGVEKPEDDCQSFAKTVKAILGVKYPQAIVWRCWSKQNGFLPRHAVLFVRGKGWIDSTRREFRDSPAPHRRAWPVGTPALVGLAATAKACGLW
jgi:hypothetical protein